MGTVAIFAAIAALNYPKGSPKHKKAGQVFMISMIIMLISGGIAGALKGVADDVFLAAMVFYSVFTAWMTVQRRLPIIVMMEYLALGYIIIFGLAALFVNSEWEMVREPSVFTFDAIVALMFALGDIRYLLCKKITQLYRLARHIWRISFALVWSALAFSDKIIKMFDSTIEQMPYVVVIPATLVLCIMFYWLFRVYKAKPSLLS